MAEKPTELGAVERDPKGRIIKGALNPGGRTKDEREVIEALRAKGLVLVKLLMRAARKGNVKAIEVALDRAYGKAKQVVELGGEGGGPVRIDASKLTREERDLVRRIRDRLAPDEG